MKYDPKLGVMAGRGGHQILPGPGERLQELEAENSFHWRAVSSERIDTWLRPTITGDGSPGRSRRTHDMHSRREPHVRERAQGRLALAGCGSRARQGCMPANSAHGNGTSATCERQYERGGKPQFQKRYTLKIALLQQALKRGA